MYITTKPEAIGCDDLKISVFTFPVYFLVIDVGMLMMQSYNFPSHFSLWKLLPLLTCSVILVIFIQRRKKKKLFAKIISSLQDPINRATAIQKGKLFEDLKHYKDSLSILEIGAGAGANFLFYPSWSKVTCLEPNEEFSAYMDNNEKISDLAENAAILRGHAEDMDMIASGSFDVVVCTFVLCSVDSQALVLKEVMRVLKPVGI